MFLFNQRQLPAYSPSVRFGLPDVDDDYLPLYGGKVWIISDHGEKLSIPYGGSSSLTWILVLLPSNT